MSRFFLFSKALGALAIVAVAACFIAPASADDLTLTSIVKTAAAPIQITKCSTATSGRVVANIRNLTTSFLLNYEIRWTPYNHAGDRIGKLDQFQQPTTALAPGDEVTGDDTYIGGVLTEPYSALGRVTCRLQSAKFEGGKSWSYGHVWTGKRIKPTVDDTSDAGDRSRLSPGTLQTSQGEARDRRSLDVHVTNAWNDTLAGNLFVHVALDVMTKGKESSMVPSMLRLKMALSNGGTKSYPAMPVSAPTYAKLNPLGSSTTTAFEVDPKEDLGRLGSVTIPAGGVAHVVATFLIGSDSVSNANDNRTVTVQ